MFKVNDRVICISNYGGNSRIVGEQGTVTRVVVCDCDEYSFLSVQFDKLINGHDCGGTCKEGHGWQFCIASLDKYLQKINKGFLPCTHRGFLCSK